MSDFSRWRTNEPRRVEKFLHVLFYIFQPSVYLLLSTILKIVAGSKLDDPRDANIFKSKSIYFLRVDIDRGSCPFFITNECYNHKIKEFLFVQK